ncbi:isoprenylcysteine carboxylmethyltransferase family protein [Candidatus Bathyarchaeota archaeon]|nr:isoprenylcysteine carboxylmethyltransferase family protein [Candidatus Bathyarchaeota archaeon]
MAPISVILLLGLIIFWGVSLQNVLKNNEKVTRDRSESPMSPGFILALFGSLSMFAESLVLIALSFTGNVSIGLGAAQVFGLSLFFSGCVLHAWSVAVRGRYAVSWSMSADQRLVTDGPYSFVRHPSYLGYMLMVLGVTAVWQMWFTYIPWVAIPGYVIVSRRDEKLLLDHFGDEYRRYMEQVGAFTPKL